MQLNSSAASASAAPPYFAQKISLEEYNQQKRDYTEKALLELKSQMAYQKPSHYTHQEDRHMADEDEDESSSSNSSGDGANVNVIIQTYKEKDTSTGLRKRRVQPTKSTSQNQDPNLPNVFQIQRELDLQEIQRLKNQITKMQSLLDEEERKNYYLKLDLCNEQVDNSNMKNSVEKRDARIKYLEEQQTRDWWIIIKLKLVLVLLVILFVSSWLF
jgi:hypothetical protein